MPFTVTTTKLTISSTSSGMARNRKELEQFGLPCFLQSTDLLAWHPHISIEKTKNQKHNQENDLRHTLRHGQYHGQIRGSVLPGQMKK